MKKKELFAYIEALDFLLVETNKRLRKLEEVVDSLQPKDETHFQREAQKIIDANLAWATPEVGTKMQISTSGSVVQGTIESMKRNISADPLEGYLTRRLSE